MVRQPSAAKRDHDHPGGGDSSNGHSPLVAGPRVVQDQRRDRCLPFNIWPRAWTLSGFSTIFVQAGLGRAYLNSIGIAVVTVASLPLTSSLGGYAFAWLRFPGRKYGFYFVLSTTMLPFVTLLIPLYVVMSKLHLVDSYVGLWLPGSCLRIRDLSLPAVRLQHLDRLIFRRSGGRRGRWADLPADRTASTETCVGRGGHFYFPGHL